MTEIGYTDEGIHITTTAGGIDRLARMKRDGINPAESVD